jgi:hypothetical protein
MNSRSKGKRGELEAAKAWMEFVGGSARRGQQFAGGNDSPDVVTSTPDIHLEVKRCERGNPYDWVEQAVRDAGGQCPVVLHRRNDKPWLLMVRLSDAKRLAALLGEEAEAMGGEPLAGDVPATGVHPTPGEDG